MKAEILCAQVSANGLAVVAQVYIRTVKVDFGSPTRTMKSLWQDERPVGPAASLRLCLRFISFDIAIHLLLSNL